jgi:hypothetical protein
MRAQALLEEALALERAQGVTLNAAVPLVGLGQTAYDQGDLSRARRLLEEAQARIVELGNQRFGGDCLLALGQVARAQGEYARAEGWCWPRACARARGSATPWRSLRRCVAASLCALCALGALGALGALAAEREDSARATVLLRQGLIRMRDGGGTRDLAACLEGLARAACAQSEFERATTLCAAAAAMRRAMGTPLPPIERASYEHALADARCELGAGRFAGLWAAGEGLTSDKAMQVALERALPGTVSTRPRTR